MERKILYHGSVGIYFSFARAFLSNQISLEQLSYAMRLRKLGEQVVLISPEAFERVHHLSNEIADTTVYFSLRMTRDEDAREAYRKVLETEDEDGVYMRDLIRRGEKIYRRSYNRCVELRGIHNAYFLRNPGCHFG